MPTTCVGVFGERQRHAAAAAAGVEHATADRHAGALEKRDDLGAPVVLEQRVVVFGAKPPVGVRLDQVVSNLAHSGKLVDEGGAIGRRRLVDVETRDVVALRIVREQLDDQPPFVTALVADARQSVGQYIAHVVAPQTVLVVAEAVADEDRPDVIFERQAVGQLAVDECAGADEPADLDRRAVVVVAGARRPLPVLKQVERHRDGYEDGRGDRLNAVAREHGIDRRPANDQGQCPADRNERGRTNG